MEGLIPSLLVITININGLSLPLNDGLSGCILNESSVHALYEKLLEQTNKG